MLEVGCCAKRLFLPCAIVARPPAHPFLESRREDEWILVATGVRNRFDLVVGRGEELRGVLHPEINHVMHRAAAEFTAAQASQMLGAEMAVRREAIE